MSLTFVPTPIGNLRDMTMRAIDALSGATLVVAEDTRVARKLLGAFGMARREIVRCDEHATQETIDAIVERAKNEAVAVTTDAGTPGISDPGSALVRAAREAGVTIEVLPGPCAAIVAAVLSGFDLRRFTFEGFVPRSGRFRRDALSEAFASERTSVWYESPHRIIKTLEDLKFLAPKTEIFLARELTKMHEQQILATPGKILGTLEIPVRGEIVFVLPGQVPQQREQEPISEDSLQREIDAGLRRGHSPAQIAKKLASLGFGERRKLYVEIAARKEELGLKRRKQ